MSFILDALRKSERERQRQTGPDIANLQTAPPRPMFPVWAIAVAALLAVNLAVVLVIVLRGEKQTTSLVASTAAAVAATPAPETSAPINPVPTAAVTPDPLPAPARTAPIPHPEPEPLAAPIAAEPSLMPDESTEKLPTIHELNFKGVNALPKLHLDIHVYATRPADRFVFINMHKYKEGVQTAEGILVERITPDGVILDRNGTRFTLPRQ